MKVFISYAHADRDWAVRLSSRLKDAGLDVWLDADTLFPGDNWPLATGRALEESDAMVALISPDALQSESVQREREYALGLEKFRGRLINVLVRPTAEFPWILKKMSWLEGDPETVSQSIVRALQSPASRPGSRALATSH